MIAACSQCGHLLLFDGINESDPRGPMAIFHCSNCDQQAHVTRDGHGGMTLATLFPPPKTAQDHWDIADYQAREKRMFAGMRLVAGWLSEAEYEEFDRKMQQVVADYKAEHPLPRSLWSRIREKVQA